MKLRDFDNFLNESAHKLTPKQLSFLNFPAKGRWKINETNGEIDISGSFVFRNKNITTFPVKFGKIYGDFDVAGSSYLESLENSPRSVSGYFCCSGCTELMSLKGAPAEVGDTFEFAECPNIPSEEQEVANDRATREIWLKSGLDIVTFLKKYHGMIRGRKFGI